MNQPTGTPGTILLLDALDRKSGLLFEKPGHVITCDRLDEVRPALAKVEAARRKGAHLAGYMAYELGFAFEEKLRKAPRLPEGPLLWFGVYDRPRDLCLAEADCWLRDRAGESGGIADTPRFEMDRECYDSAFGEARDHLARGDIYQVNLTLRARFRHEGAPARLFRDLLVSQPVPYAAYMELGPRTVLSLSPELFLKRERQTLTAKPMKGTAPRGRGEAEDRRLARDLTSDPKQRAENIMIVDLMRNDLSRVAETGSVKVSELCTAERYRSVFQMTSTVTAQLRQATEFPQIVEHLFPCGSITGAPKLSAMQIINRLEKSPRGIYTGSIGHIGPSGDFTFNVAIRTLVLEAGGTGEVGTGSGVVFDSGAGSEYDECALKLKFMTDPDPGFGLIETMAWTPDDGFLLLERHLSRLEISAAYFDFSCDRKAIREQLLERARTFDGPRRVRLEMSATGGLALSETGLAEAAADTCWPVVLAAEKTRAADKFFYHKTTRRQFYDETRQAYAQRLGCQEVIFQNEDGYLTEGSFTTLFLDTGGKLKTPALHHGLLPGTLRAGLLERGLAVEADLRARDLEAADSIYVGNSVRGLVRARLIKVPK